MYNMNNQSNNSFGEERYINSFRVTLTNYGFLPAADARKLKTIMKEPTFIKYWVRPRGELSFYSSGRVYCKRRPLFGVITIYYELSMKSYPLTALEKTTGGKKSSPQSGYTVYTIREQQPAIADEAFCTYIWTDKTNFPQKPVLRKGTALLYPNNRETLEGQFNENDEALPLPLEIEKNGLTRVTAIFFTKKGIKAYARDCQNSNFQTGSVRMTKDRNPVPNYLPFRDWGEPMKYCKKLTGWFKQ